jgi:hypothetical protein
MKYILSHKEHPVLSIDIDDELYTILSDSITVDNERKDRLCYGLLGRIKLLDTVIENNS